VKDTGNQTTGINLATTEFTEIEYALQPTANATDGALYCFRLTDAGSTADFSYTQYAEATVEGVDNFLLEAQGGGDIGTQTAGVPFNIQITARDYLGNTVTNFNGTVDITSTGSLLAGGGTTAAFTNGVLASHSVTIGNTGTFMTTATGTSTTAGGTSNPFAVNPGGASATTSSMTAAPTSITADGTSTSTITVQLKDANGNNLTTGGDTVMLATTLGTLSALTDNGDSTYTATLTSATITGTATVTGTVNAVAITDNATPSFTVGAASATTSLITALPTSVTANGISSLTITVQLKDSNGNIITTGGDSITLATTLGTLSAVTDNGNGTYTATLTSATTTGTATISGTVNGQAITDSATVNFIAGVATQLAFTVQPANAQATVPISPAIRVQVQDATGNLVSTGTNNITLTFANNPGGATLSGTLTVVSVGGVATFSNISIDRIDAGYTLTASGAGLVSATSASFDITVGIASTLASVITASPTSIPADGASNSTITVQLKDSNGNNLTTGGDTVTLAVSLGSLSVVTDNNNGTYGATLTSTTTGNATITGTVNGQ